MPKKISIMLISLLMLPSAFASENLWGTQVAVLAGGIASFSLVHYTNHFSGGIGVGGKINNAADKTQLITPALFAGGRAHIKGQTYFAYGVDLSSRFGKQDGQKINDSITTGPYISVETLIGQHVMLSGFVNPYSYTYEKLDNVGVSTHKFFATGGIGIAYVWGNA